MADLAAVAAVDVAAVQVIEQRTLPAAEAITAGQLVGIDANGLFCLADADAVAPIVTRGIAITSANQANMTITAVVKGLVDCGDIFDAMGFGDAVFSSATPGLMADAVVNAQAAIGRVEPAWGAVAADKLLRVDL